jgi:D-beta-D-heptose 7-phosphate kinase/D-beta-D-heptose 1-phosphate adenosyltransferase
VKKAQEANIRVYVDSKKSDLSYYKQCIIKINRIEYENLKKVSDDCELIVTTGKHGARWNNKVYPTEECDVFDVCGAGDTFLASFVFQHLLAKSIEEAIQFANKCSRLVVGKFGTYTLTSEDVENLRM